MLQNAIWLMAKVHARTRKLVAFVNENAITELLRWVDDDAALAGVIKFGHDEWYARSTHRTLI